MAATQHCMSSQPPSFFPNNPNIHHHRRVDSCVTYEMEDKMFCAWKPPLSGFIAVNCDGSFRPRDGSFGYGVIARNQWGEFLAAKANYEKNSPKELSGPILILMVELMAIRDGIELLGKQGFRCLEVQSDSKNAVEIVNDQARCPKECTDVLKEIIANRNEFFRKDDFRCVFVYREANRAADFLSKYMKSGREQYFFIGDPLPDDLRRIVKEDVNHFYVRYKK